MVRIKTPHNRTTAKPYNRKTAKPQNRKTAKNYEKIIFRYLHGHDDFRISQCTE